MGGKLFVICNTLVEKVVAVDETVLTRFGVPKGDSLYVSDPALVQQIDSFLSGAQIYSGGSGANMAHGAANLGMDVAFAGTVGNDTHAEHFANDFSLVGVKAHLKKQQQMHGVVYILITPDNERSFIVVRGASYDYSAEHIPQEVLLASQFFHTTAYALSFASGGALHALELAHKQGLLTSLDLSSPSTIQANKKTVEYALTKTRLLFISKQEATAFGFRDKNVIDYMHTEFGIPTIAYKMGKDGAIISEKGKRTFIPAQKVPVVSETGAGDAFAAGVVNGISKGENLKIAGLRGAFYAAQVIGQMPSRLLNN